MRELKMLQKEALRSSKPGISKLKKPQKISVKSLGDTFDSIAEETSPMKSMESARLSPIPVAREASSENFDLLDPELSASPGMSLHTELSPFSEITFVENVEPGVVSPTNCGFDGVSDSKMSFLEAQITVSALRKATSQVLSSDEVDSQAKKLIYVLVEMAIEILETAPQVNDRISEILAAKTRIVSRFFLLCVFATVAARLLLGSGSRSSHGKPPPT